MKKNIELGEYKNAYTKLCEMEHNSLVIRELHIVTSELTVE